MEVELVRSPTQPVIGVGESTTANMPLVLHRTLGIDIGRFFREVEPTWKLGISFDWGLPDNGHFVYPFSLDLSNRPELLRKPVAHYVAGEDGHSGVTASLMENDLSPCVVDDSGRAGLLPRPFGYHIDNEKFIAFLQRYASELGVKFVAADVTDVGRNESGDVHCLHLADQGKIEADLFIDCSGFQSRLLSQVMRPRFVSYRDALFCDRAAVVSLPRNEGSIKPYTSATTMRHGWCWTIELRNRVTKGYVYSSEHCSQQEAEDELRIRFPQFEGFAREIHFPSGRFEKFWCGNVIAVGNASGFVEPLEATSLHVIAEHLIRVCAALRDSDFQVSPIVREIENERYRNTWDAIRDFLAVHYRFNRRLSTPFWERCHQEIDLRNAAPIVEAFQEIGPHGCCAQLVPKECMFKLDGYFAMLIGQGIPTKFSGHLSDADREDWQSYQQAIHQQVSKAIPIREALTRVDSPAWQWG